MDLLLRKGVYPYEYMDSIAKFREPQLPAREAFFNRLNDEELSETDYEHAQKVWQAMRIKDMREYHDFYLGLDVTLLADCFEHLRKVSRETFGLDVAHYYTLPGYAYDVMLKMTGVRLELLSDIDMLQMIEGGIRGGVTVASHRYAKANNPYLDDFDASKPTNYLTYLDANNLYGCAMSKYMPTDGFEWVEDHAEIPTVEAIDPEAEKGYFLEVDLDYPQELHDAHNDYPFAPESMEIGKVRKLVPNLHDKKKYVIHSANLKQYVGLGGLRLRKIHRAIRFNQRPWLKEYVNKLTALRTAAATDFERDFFKLMVNAVFGKTMENVRKRQDIRLVTASEEKKATKMIAKPHFKKRTVFDENLAAIHMRKTKVKMIKPIYLGFSILERSKTIMNDFVHGYLKPKYGSRAKVCYTDTDSIICDVQTDDVYKDMAGDAVEWFDTSNFPQDHPSGIVAGLNKKVLGKFKDECGGIPMKEYVGLRAKMYSHLTPAGETKRAKGVKRCVVEKGLTHQDFKDCLLTHTEISREMRRFQSRLHELFTLTCRKKALSAQDDKRHILPDGISTLAHGHYRIPK